jgi:hypothetical protein
MKLKVLFTIWWFMLLSVPLRADVTTPTVYINPDLFSFEPDGTLKLTSAGGKLGWFQVSRIFGPTEQAGSIALENMDMPSKRIYLWGPDGRRGQIFSGTNRIACYRCTGSGPNDPNEGAPCGKDKLDKNTCVSCTPALCKDVIEMVKIHDYDGEDRADMPPAGFAENKKDGNSYEGESIYKQLGLVKPAE